MRNFHCKKTDLDRKEKQHHQGVLRLAGIDSVGRVNSDIIEKVRREHPGIAQYLTFLRFFLQIFISTEPIASKLKMAGYVLAYLALWRRLIRTSRGRRTIKLNFMTTPTFEDIVIAVSNFVLYTKFMRIASEPRHRDTYGKMELRFLPAFLTSVGLENFSLRFVERCTVRSHRLERMPAKSMSTTTCGRRSLNTSSAKKSQVRGAAMRVGPLASSSESERLKTLQFQTAR